jgi:hypothetical protein
MFAALLLLSALAAEEDGVDEAPPSTSVVLRAQPGAPLVSFAHVNDTVYVVDARAVVHASHDGGRTWRVGRFPARRSSTASMFSPLVEPTDDVAEDDALEDPIVDDGEPALDEGGVTPEPIDPFALQQSFGYVGNNVWLDIGSSILLKSSAGELFAFPYGTTGEAYLEFTPDSPAFWDPQWLNGLRRPDIRYADTTAPFVELSEEHDTEDDDADAVVEADEEVRIVVDRLDPRIAELHGPFGIERTDDGGATWFPADDAERLPADASQGDATPKFTMDAHALRGDVPRNALDYGTLKRLRARGPSIDAIVSGARDRFAPPVDLGGGGASLLPRIDVVGGGIVFLDATFAGDADFVRQTAEVSTDNGEDAAFVRAAPVVNPFVVLLLSWDLPSLFAPSSSPADHRAARDAWAEVEGEVIEAIDARDAVLVDLASMRGDEPDDVLVDRTLALQEAEARISALSGVTFPAIGGPAAKALSRALPEPEALPRVIARAQRNLRVGDDDVSRLAGGAAFRAAVPSFVVAASYVDTSLDEFDFLDEIGIDIPWVSKSANGRIVEARARLSWDFPRTLRSGARSERDARATLARVRKDVALATTHTYFERRRAQAAYARAPRDARFDEGLVVDELTAILAGLTGPALPDDDDDERNTR